MPPPSPFSALKWESIILLAIAGTISWFLSMEASAYCKAFLVQKIGGRGQRHSIYYCQGWLSSKIKEQLRRPNESLSSVLEFKEFVAFLLDKEGAFEQVKRDFNASFFFMDDHWSSYYK